MENRDRTNRHLLDLCVRSERAGIWSYSGFLSLAEQDDFTRSPESACYEYSFYGGYEAAERKLLVAGTADVIGYLPDPPVCVIAVKPASQKFAEDLSHRDYLGAILNLGIERSLVGDILVKEKQAWFFCLDSVADYLVSALTRVRNTTVSAAFVSGEVPELQPRFESLRLNVASERLDAVLSAFTGLSRARTEPLFSGEKVFVNGRVVTDKSMKLKEDDIVSVRGFGKVVYDGIEYETRKSRLWVSLRKYV